MNRLVESWAIGLEGVRAFRVGLGLFCLVDLLGRGANATFFLSDAGAVPRSLCFSLLHDSPRWSLFMVSGRPSVVILLCVVITLLSALQVSGRSSRLSRAGLFVLMLSLQNRCPPLTDQADDLLRVLLFWDMLLPDLPLKKALTSPVSVGLQCQLSLVLGSTLWALIGASTVGLWGLTVLSLGALLGAVWLPWRNVLLPVAGVGLLILAVCEDFWWFSLLGVAGSLYWPPQAAFPSVRTTSGSGVVVVLLGLILVSQGPVSVSSTHWAWKFTLALGLQQRWESLPNSAGRGVARLWAIQPGASKPFWSLPTGRRANRFLLSVQRNPAWSRGLGTYLKAQYQLTSEPQLWLRTDEAPPRELLLSPDSAGEGAR